MEGGRRYDSMACDDYVSTLSFLSDWLWVGGSIPGVFRMPGEG